MEDLTPTQQQDEEQDDLVGGGATGSVEEGTAHGNTLATLRAPSSRRVQFLEVESPALDGDDKRSGRGGHGWRRNSRTQ